ncbi:hypothetical protein BDN72DRAFT_843484 [Pluteus cervinus]|uniref:Uncharacterized protein n=1 Tax=Pluteus cervinus TaxID=181527 RepID=A0ACD3AN31_9AGAR|nr:hypothetical protein BDN72DRAFT_843484 [Pluteus cervinus]
MAFAFLKSQPAQSPSRRQFGLSSISFLSSSRREQPAFSDDPFHYRKRATRCDIRSCACHSKPTPLHRYLMRPFALREDDEESCDYHSSFLLPDLFLFQVDEDEEGEFDLSDYDSDFDSDDVLPSYYHHQKDETSSAISPTPLPIDTPSSSEIPSRKSPKVLTRVWHVLTVFMCNLTCRQRYRRPKSTAT